MRARILVVDDEPVIAQLLGRCLGDQYTVLTVQSPVEALSVAANFRPDLIMLDVHMPEMNGWELCRRLRQQQEFDAIPIIFLSAWQRDEDVSQGMGHGADFYLSKPCDVTRIKSTLAALLGRPHRYPDEPSSNVENSRY
ncbi:MAG TPA: response regulator [Elusimicrobiota bacterium]|nr:response regulator [Elusimicrobiota bacterium]